MKFARLTLINPFVASVRVLLKLRLSLERTIIYACANILAKTRPHPAADWLLLAASALVYFSRAQRMLAASFLATEVNHLVLTPVISASD